MWSTWKRLSPFSSCPSDRLGAARYWAARAAEAERRGDKAAALRRRARAAALDPHSLSGDYEQEFYSELLKLLKALTNDAK